MSSAEHFNLGTAAGRGDSVYRANSARFSGTSIDSSRFGGKEIENSETNFVSSNKGIASSGTF
jgi:hypothetical protein